MAKVTATIDDKALLAMIRRTTGPSAIKRVEARLRTEAETIAENARAEFPVSRWGSGKVKDKDHARDSIEVVSRITPNQITYSVVSSVKYIYYIRSYQIAESESAQKDRFRRRRGESDADYDARRTVGRKRQAWNTLVSRPGKKISKKLAAEIGDDLLHLAKGS